MRKALYLIFSRCLHSLSPVWEPSGIPRPQTCLTSHLRISLPASESRLRRFTRTLAATRGTPTQAAGWAWFSDLRVAARSSRLLPARRTTRTQRFSVGLFLGVVQIQAH